MQNSSAGKIRKQKCDRYSACTDYSAHYFSHCPGIFARQRKMFQGGEV